MQTAVPAGTAVFRGKRKRTDSRFAAFGGRGELRSPFSAPKCPLRDIPVFRMAYFPIPHRPTFGAPVFRSAYSASRNARASAAFAASIKPYLCSKTLDLQPLRSPSGGRGELRSPLHPPLPPPLFIGRFAAFDRQIPKEDVFIPPNAAFAQLSLAHSAAFCYSFLNNRTRCGKRRLLP